MLTGTGGVLFIEADLARGRARSPNVQMELGEKTRPTEWRTVAPLPVKKILPQLRQSQRIAEKAQRMADLSREPPRLSATEPKRVRSTADSPTHRGKKRKHTPEVDVSRKRIRASTASLQRHRPGVLSEVMTGEPDASSGLTSHYTAHNPTCRGQKRKRTPEVDVSQKKGRASTGYSKSHKHGAPLEAQTLIGDSNTVVDAIDCSSAAPSSPDAACHDRQVLLPMELDSRPRSPPYYPNPLPGNGDGAETDDPSKDMRASTSSSCLTTLSHDHKQLTETDETSRKKKLSPGVRSKDDPEDDSESDGFVTAPCPSDDNAPDSGDLGRGAVPPVAQFYLAGNDATADEVASPYQKVTAETVHPHGGGTAIGGNSSITFTTIAQPTSGVTRPLSVPTTRCMSDDETRTTDDDGYIPSGEETSEEENRLHNFRTNIIGNDDDVDHTTSSEENSKVVECSDIDGQSQSNDEAALDDTGINSVDGDDGMDTPRASKSSLYSRHASIADIEEKDFSDEDVDEVNSRRDLVWIPQEQMEAAYAARMRLPSRSLRAKAQETQPQMGPGIVTTTT
ncbi:hypothetical protein WOLCODRAFT_168115 [Wolfiporia cocos MD-104 SS10]|uniref:Uncharacterized protein n=1 Tax=Wolfiporia cocos (strain MD-104) TaxID=742152 RepID=A0A2H3JFD4_WOLCO|nr:hypothetical protein WOLCODRAFT_168115 [Wolfiporia cocos MD-104 SS10]